jgi:hypothetical protein
VKGKSKDQSCGALTGDFTLQDGGCTSATGTVTIKRLGSFNDTITHTGKAISHPPQADTSMLTAGFKKVLPPPKGPARGDAAGIFVAYQGVGGLASRVAPY